MRVARFWPRGLACATMAGMRVVLVVAALAVAVLLLPSTASASCAAPRPAPLLAAVDAAFVGRLVETRSDRWVFAVDEAVKGPLGAQVEVLRPRSGGAITSIDLAPVQNERVGLLLEGDAATGWRSNACLQLSPAQLRAAAAHPDLRCWAPVIGSVRFRVPGRVDVALRRLDDPETTVRVDWGDGTVTTRRLGRGAARRTVVLRHRLQPGRHRLRVSVSAEPVTACGTFDENVATAPLVVRT
jgi:hypothetical protein